MTSSSIGRAFRQSFLLGTLAGAAVVNAGCDQATPTTPPTNAAASVTGKEPPLPATAEAPSAAAQVEPPTLATVPFVMAKPSAFNSGTKTTTACALDTLGGNPAAEVNTVQHDGRLRLVGWATDDVNSGSIPPVVGIELAGRKSAYAMGARVTKRQDVADTLKIPLLATAGYDVDATFNDVPAGEYTVNVLQVNAAGDALTCATKRKLKVE
jgi:hypothetical protein